MKIINKTKWRTEDLRAFVAKIIPVEIDDPKKRAQIVVMFVCHRSKAGWCSGLAWSLGRKGGRRCLIRVVNPAHGIEVDKVDLCGVIAHELAHLRGLPGGHASERAMRTSIPYGRNPKSAEYYSWSDNMPLRRMEAKPKPTVEPIDKLQSDIERLQERVAAWTSKQKRATNAIKKYQKQIQYRQKRLEAFAAGRTIERKPRLEKYGPPFDPMDKVDEWDLDDGGPGNKLWTAEYKPGWRSARIGGENDPVHYDREFPKSELKKAVREAEPCHCENCRKGRFTI